MNACEYLTKRPDLSTAVDGIVRHAYARYRDLMDDSAYDVEDLSQELMLALLEEPARSTDEATTLLCHNRLQDIARRLRRTLTDEGGDRVELDEYIEDYNETHHMVMSA